MAITPTGVQSAGRNTNSIMAGWVDRGPWQYYDTINLAAATASSLTFYPFSLPIGSIDPVTTLQKQKYDTNMQRSNQFAPPKCLLLMSLGIGYDPSVLLSDIIALQANSYIEFKIDDKVFHEGLIPFFPLGMGTFGASTQNGESAWQNGFPTPQTTRRYQDWAKYIAPDQNFSCTWYLRAAVTPTAAVKMRWVMDGLTDRSVQ